jgi:hypothetical protein
MTVKLVDHEVRAAKGIDAVFDVRGQNTHDVVPGAFLAMKAKAVMKNLSNEEELKP